MAEAHCRNVDVLLGKLETIYRRAVDDRHFAAAARAVELQAKLAGVGPAPTRPAVRGRPAAAMPSEDDNGCDPTMKREEIGSGG